jgi:hypothetical protein
MHAPNPALDVRLERADDTDPGGLVLRSGSFMWVGAWAADLERRAKHERVRVTASQAGVIATADVWVLDVLRQLPLPPPAFIALARFFWTHHAARAEAFADGAAPTDMCLWRALCATDPRARTITRHTFAREVVATLPFEGAGISEVALRASGEPVWIVFAPGGVSKIGVMTSTGPRHHDVGITGERVYLVAPLDDPREDPLVATYAHMTSSVRVFVRALRGDFDEPLVFTMAAAPTCFFIAEGRLWLHGPGETVGIAVDDARRRVHADDVRIAQPSQRGAVTERPIRIGPYITGAYIEPGADPKKAVRSLSWVDLRAPSRALCIGTAGSPQAMFVHDGALIATSYGALHRARPGEVATVVAKGAFLGAAVAADGIWVGETFAGGQYVTRLDPLDGTVRSRTEVPFLVHTLVAVGDDVLAMSSMQIAYVRASGERLVMTAQRREVGHAVLSDGTVVFCAGEELVVVKDGAVVRARAMPYDGTIIGSVVDHALFGPATGGGFERSPPDGVHMIDARGESVAILRPEAEKPPYVPMTRTWPRGALRTSRVGDASSVFLIEQGGRTLSRHRPCAAGRETRGAASAPWQTPSREAERIVQFDTTNPRDDWKVPGLEVRGRGLVAIGCTYAGTTGVAPGPAIEAHDGAVVVLVDCDLREGGLDVQGDSVVILVRCTVGTKARTVSPTSRVFAFS